MKQNASVQESTCQCVILREVNWQIMIALQIATEKSVGVSISKIYAVLMEVIYKFISFQCSKRIISFPANIIGTKAHFEKIVDVMDTNSCNKA